MIGFFLACSILLVFDYAEILKLNQFGKLAKPILIILTIFSGSLSLTGIISYFKDLISEKRKPSLLAARRKLKAAEDEKERIETEHENLQRLDHLSHEEIVYLADCLRKGSQSFFTYVHSPPVTTLMGKGLVYTPGGAHHQDHYPYTVCDYVWVALLERKDEFIEKDEAHKREEAKKKQRGRGY